MSPFYLIVIFLLPIAVPSKAENYCDKGYFECREGGCVKWSYLCDGQDDCSDGSDEKVCPPPPEECGDGEFRCKSGACITKSGDGNDEKNCLGYCHLHRVMDEYNFEPAFRYRHPKCNEKFVPKFGPYLLKIKPEYFENNTCNGFKEGTNFHKCSPELGYQSFEEIVWREDDLNRYRNLTVTLTPIYTEGCDFKSSADLENNYGKYDKGKLIVSLSKFTWKSDVYKVEIVRRDKLQLAACYKNSILLPSEPTPSCHSSNYSQCGWKIVDGVQTVKERPELIGSQFKIVSENATFLSETVKDFKDSVCILLELLNPETNQNPRIELSVITDGSNHVLFNKNIIPKDSRWYTEKIIADILPEDISIESLQFKLEIKNATGSYLNKIYGCNPYNEESRVLVDLYKGDANAWMRDHSKLVTESNPFCLNGGTRKLDNSTKCYCPPGFGGELCEIACGDNRWGPNCEYDCSGVFGDCRNVFICNTEEDYNIDCRCAAGFDGYPPFKCFNRCKKFTYGSGCQQACGHCKWESACNITTGHCDQGCDEGYKPPFCKQKYITTFVKPVVRNVSYNEATIEINYKDLRGDGTPSIYQIYYRDVSEEYWRETRFKKIVSLDKITGKLTDLTAGINYEAKIVVRDENANGNSNVPSVNFTTDCIMNHNLEVSYSLNRYSHVVNVSWEDQNTLNQFKCHLVEMQVELFSGSKKHYYITNNGSIEFKSLQVGDIKYRLRVRAIGLTNGLFSAFSPSVTFVTPPDEFAKVINFKVTNVSSDSVQAEWTSKGTRDYMIRAECLQVLDNDISCPPGKTQFNVKENHTLIDGLRPNTLYKISASQRPSHELSEIKFITREAVPEVEPRKDNMTVTGTTVQLSLLPPEDCYGCNGELIGYYYELFGPDNKILQQNKTEHSSIFIDGLEPEKTYKILSYNQNSVGYNKTSYLETTFTTLPIKS